MNILASRRQFFAAASPLLGPMMAVALALPFRRARSHAPIRRAVAAWEAAKARREEVLAQWDEVIRLHPYASDGGTSEDFLAQCDWEESALGPATVTYHDASEALTATIRAAGYRAVIVDGKIYMAVTRGEYDEEQHMGLDVGQVLDLDAWG